MELAQEEKDVIRIYGGKFDTQRKAWYISGDPKTGSVY